MISQSELYRVYLRYSLETPATLELEYLNENQFFQTIESILDASIAVESGGEVYITSCRLPDRVLSRLHQTYPKNLLSKSSETTTWITLSVTASKQSTLLAEAELHHQFYSQVYQVCGNHNIKIIANVEFDKPQAGFGTIVRPDACAYDKARAKAGDIHDTTAKAHLVKYAVEIWSIGEAWDFGNKSQLLKAQLYMQYASEVVAIHPKFNKYVVFTRKNGKIKQQEKLVSTSPKVELGDGIKLDVSQIVDSWHLGHKVDLENERIAAEAANEQLKPRRI